MQPDGTWAVEGQWPAYTGRSRYTTRPPREDIDWGTIEGQDRLRKSITSIIRGTFENRWCPIALLMQELDWNPGPTVDDLEAVFKRFWYNFEHYWCEEQIGVDQYERPITKTVDYYKMKGANDPGFCKGKGKGSKGGYKGDQKGNYKGDYKGQDHIDVTYGAWDIHNEPVQRGEQTAHDREVQHEEDEAEREKVDELVAKLHSLGVNINPKNVKMDSFTQIEMVLSALSTADTTESSNSGAQASGSGSNSQPPKDQDRHKQVPDVQRPDPNKPDVSQQAASQLPGPQDATTWEVVSPAGNVGAPLPMGLVHRN